MVKIVKNPGNGRLNNLNDLVLNVLTWVNNVAVLLSKQINSRQLMIPPLTVSVFSKPLNYVAFFMPHEAGIVQLI